MRLLPICFDAECQRANTCECEYIVFIYKITNAGVENGKETHAVSYRMKPTLIRCLLNWFQLIISSCGRMNSVR